MESRTINNLSGSDELFHVLDKLVSLHRNLLDLLNEEYAHMTSLDVQSLFEVAQTKEVLVNEIWSYEKLRAKVSEKFATSLRLAPDASLEEIAAVLSSKDNSDKLRNLRKVMRLLVEQAKESNTRNMEFAKSSLTRVEDMKKNILGMNNNNNENYSQSGARQPLSEHGGRLLETEA